MIEFNGEKVYLYYSKNYKTLTWNVCTCVCASQQDCKSECIGQHADLILFWLKYIKFTVFFN